MKGFDIDENGDVVIENNEINIVVGASLIQQKVRTVLQTNLKEWFFDWWQGIDFSNLLGKGKTDEMARYEIERGLAQVDSTFAITEFEYSVDSVARAVKIHFMAQNDGGETVGGDYTWR